MYEYNIIGLIITHVKFKSPYFDLCIETSSVKFSQLSNLFTNKNLDRRKARNQRRSTDIRSRSIVLATDIKEAMKQNAAKVKNSVQHTKGLIKSKSSGNLKHVTSKDVKQKTMSDFMKEQEAVLRSNTDRNSESGSIGRGVRREVELRGVCNV